jgi:hypothetical protein
MCPNSVWPDDPRAAAALVGLVVEDIDTADDGDRQALLESMQRVAWPTIRAQSQ